LVEDFEHSHCPSSSRTDENVQKVLYQFSFKKAFFPYVCQSRIKIPDILQPSPPCVLTAYTCHSQLQFLPIETKTLSAIAVTFHTTTNYNKNIHF
jgi:hypothetical protein